jgi:hypothetical protein
MTAWGVVMRLGMRTAQTIVREGRQRDTSPFDDFTVSRAVTWLEPTLHVELTHSELMEGRLRDPVYRGLAEK